MGRGAPPMPPFGPAHVQKIRKAIDSGIPAIFLTKYLQPIRMGFFPMPQSYALNDYLKKDWGLEARTEYRAVAGLPDERAPGMFTINAVKYQYLPLSSFTNHPIGRPLQGQRMLWNDVCPIREIAEDKPKDVTIQPLLTARRRKDVWATRSVPELVQKILTDDRGLFAPDYAPGRDLRTPFHAIVAASRGKSDSPARKASRIVLVGTGGLVDAYLSQRIPKFDAKGGISFTDPPTANADLVINSVYWLIGRDKYIAAGPPQVKPVEMISTAAMSVLWTLVVVCLPLAVLGIGGLVMLVRRR